VSRDLRQDLCDQVVPSGGGFRHSIAHRDLLIHQVIGVAGPDPEIPQAEAQALSGRHLCVGEALGGGVHAEQVIRRDLQGLGNSPQGDSSGLGLPPKPLIHGGLLEARTGDQIPRAPPLGREEAGDPTAGLFPFPLPRYHSGILEGIAGLVKFFLTRA